MGRTSWMQTFQGYVVTIPDIDVEVISIRDISRSLSQQCRYQGHTLFHYSVAQHSLYVADYVESINPEFTLEALMHDAAEAYIGDIPRPIKDICPGIRDFEANVEAAVAKKFGLIWPYSYSMECVIKYADLKLLATESIQVMRTPHPKAWDLRVAPLNLEIIPMDMEQAEADFLFRFEALIKERRSQADGGKA